MFRPRVVLVAALLAATSAQCLLYTDPINEGPDVEIFGPDTVNTRQVAKYIARPSDANQDPASLRVDWFQTNAAGAAECPTTLAAADARDVMESRRGLELTLVPAAPGTLCLWAIVTDDEGARAFRGKAVRIANQPPQPRIEVIAPALAAAGARVLTSDEVVVPLYATVALSGRKSTDPDGDSLKTEWTLAGPDGPPAKAPCPASAPGAEACFVATVAGRYTAELHARDQHGAAERAVLHVVVKPDGPPCLRETDPPPDALRITRAANQRVWFEVLRVDDDGDPFPPAGRGTFSWSFRRGESGDFDRFASNLPSLGFEASRFQPGDVVQVRVTYADRQKDRKPPACAPDAVACESEPGCPHWLTWTVVYR